MIAKHHLDALAASGITGKRAELRGYETVNDKARLIDVGVAQAGRRVPGLLVPSLRADGSTWGYQYRPDYPRTDGKGREVKYETPVEQRNGIDIPPGVGDKVGDPSVPLFITEGVKKADCAAEHGLCCVALPGVWSWRGKNDAGGKTAVADWHDVALNERRVILAFDGDVARKPSVRQALSALADYLRSKGAKVEYLHLPDTDNKTGLDDYLIGHTVEELWRLVKPSPPPTSEGRTSNATEDARRSEPVAAEPVHDGAGLLDDVQAFLARFVAYPSEHALIAHVLWIAHTWLMDAWESTPRIAFLSPEPGSGKSRALEVTEPLVPRPVHAVNTTPAYLFRKVSDEEGRPTILYDEIDTVFGPKAKDNEDIRGMLNAGHRKGATAGRCVMRGKVVETEELPAYCAVALAGLDDLPDTIMTRSVVVRMRRRAPGEKVEPWRPRINHPEAHRLRAQLSTWAGARADDLAGDFWPDIPAEVTDRDADVWEALLAVADLAGGDWPQRARVAAVALVAASKQRTPSTGVLLLRDIKAVFTEAGEEHLTTLTLLARLNSLDESPWSTIRRGEPLDGRGLSQRLNKYGIGSKLHAGERGLRGYTRAQFTDAWSRYLPDVSATSAPPAPESEESGADVADVADESRPTRDQPRLRPVVTGPGRCDTCGCHIETQGHKPECPAAAA